MPAITTEIEIAAPPATVRAKFLEFDEIPYYAPDGFIQSIKSATGKSPIDILKGDVLKCVVGGGSMKITPVVLENSPQVFTWRGALPGGIFVGDHSFRFKPVEGNINATLLVHEEIFSGILSWMMGENSPAGWIGQRHATQTGFEGFNRDFKKWIESK